MYRRFQIRLAVVFLALAANSFGREGLAATFNIANGDVAGLIAAINTANSNNQNDTINLAPGGVYNLTAADNISSDGNNGFPKIGGDNGHNLTIDGGTAVTIQRVAGSPQFRFFYIQQGTNVVLGGLVLKGGDDPGNYSQAVEEGGGAIVNRGGTVRLNECTLDGNRAAYRGGAIYNHAVFDTTATVTLYRCILTNNTASSGGAIQTTRTVPRASRMPMPTWW